jgi:hypothetical protein
VSQLRLSFSALVISGMLFTVACGPQSEDTSAPSNGSTAGQLNGTDGIGQFCGGFAAIPCPEGLTCVDDPRDTCNPDLGGRDCGGICVGLPQPSSTVSALSTDSEADKKKCDYNDPNLRYVSRDPAQCAAIFFFCQEGETTFFNDCGCGCATAQ